MGICYTYLLHDERDWDYVDFTKEMVIERIKKELPQSIILAEWCRYIVIDLDKVPPSSDEAKMLKKHCENLSYYTDSAPWRIESC